MAAKLIQLSDDNGSIWNTLPGGEGELNRELTQIEDTIFGQSYQSNEAGLITWNVAAQAFYKGFAGYVADIKEPGTPTSMTTEAMSVVSGKTYQIDDVVKRVIDRDSTITVFDNAVDETAEVISIDYLFGRVTFSATHTPTTPITITADYLPMALMGKAQSIALTMAVDAIEDSEFDTMQTNGGYRTFKTGGLRTVSLDLTGIYALASGFEALLTGRTETVIELNPDGAGAAAGSIARGFFKLGTMGQSGAVGALEEETINAFLVVPDDAETPIEFPFGWEHGATSPLSTAIRVALQAFEDEAEIDVQYLPDGVTGDKGACIVTEIGLTTTLDGMNEFSINGQGVGQTTAV